MWASTNGNKEVVELLIENGVDVNAKDKFGNTSLYYAYKFGNNEIIDLLKNAELRNKR